MSEWRKWGEGWPDWQDIGKLAEFKMPGGEIVRGELEYEDMTPGPEEHPLIFIRRENGTQASLVNAEHWRYVTG